MILKKIVEGVEQIFPDFDIANLNTDTCLGEIPDWDSLNAINLQTFLEEAFQISIPLEILNAETRIGDLIVYIETTPRQRLAS
ncbi:MAG: acyl carrier protein [Syntrophales bacterium]